MPSEEFYKRFQTEGEIMYGEECWDDFVNTDIQRCAEMVRSQLDKHSIADDLFALGEIMQEETGSPASRAMLYHALLHSGQRELADNVFYNIPEEYIESVELFRNTLEEVFAPEDDIIDEFREDDEDE